MFETKFVGPFGHLENLLDFVAEVFNYTKMNKKVNLPVEGLQSIHCETWLLSK